MHIKIRLQQASDQVLMDLINALLLENTFNITSRGEVVFQSELTSLVSGIALQAEEQIFRLWLEKEKRYLVFPITASPLRQYQISHPLVVLVWFSSDGSLMSKMLDPVEVMKELVGAFHDQANGNVFPNLDGFLEELRLAVEQTAISLEAFSSKVNSLFASGSSLIEMECLASFRDRPFHPTSRAKLGWDEAAYRRFSPEFSQNLSLAWVAVRRDYLMCSKAVEGNSVSDFILQPMDRLKLETAFQENGISDADYIALPVHPWQEKHILPQEFKLEFKTKICVNLKLKTGSYIATSSIRSLAPVQGGDHVKLPIGIYSLAALRLLPIRYLINGEKGQKLLEQVIDKDPELQKRVYLCDEIKWWSFFDINADLFDDKLGQLSCLIRQYPSSLINDKRVQLIPMSALSVYGYSRNHHLFEQWLRIRGDKNTKKSVLNLFEEISNEIVVTALTFARYGIMPEMHGQNVLLILRGGYVVGLLLRDHDTVRLHLPWMKQTGIQNPNYLLKENLPNTLINETPEKLFAYFQTLVIQVNLSAIIDALSHSYEINESEFWSQLKSTLKRSIDAIDFSEGCRALFEELLFFERNWPFKQLISPLLNRQGTGGGSMPSDMGLIKNPFHNLETMR